jgi:ComF family protein
MNKSLDDVFGLLAPHLCLACGLEGSLLCKSCLQTAGEPIAPRCAGCHALTQDFKTCKSCSSWLKVSAVYVATIYEGVYEKILRELKFNAKRQAIYPIAHIMADCMRQIDNNTILCPLPTASSRIRQRGFDHTKMLTIQLNKLSGLHQEYFLKRKTNVRQVGSSREQRIEQMEQEFYVDNPESIKDRNILLVDDVVTTGASLSGAARVLKKVGAKQVQAIVFAQKI